MLDSLQKKCSPIFELTSSYDSTAFYLDKELIDTINTGKNTNDFIENNVDILFDKLIKKGSSVIEYSDILTAKQIEEESYYGTNKSYDLDAFDDEGYSQLVKDEEFDPGLPEEDI
jgi:hypothetical protein